MATRLTVDPDAGVAIFEVIRGGITLATLTYDNATQLISTPARGAFVATLATEAATSSALQEWIDLCQRSFPSVSLVEPPAFEFEIKRTSLGVSLKYETGDLRVRLAWTKATDRIESAARPAATLTIGALASFVRRQREWIALCRSTDS